MDDFETGYPKERLLHLSTTGSAQTEDETVPPPKGLGLAPETSAISFYLIRVYRYYTLNTDTVAAHLANCLYRPETLFVLSR